MQKIEFSLLGRNNYKLTDFITIHIPTIGEIKKTEISELEYCQSVYFFTRTQCDLIVELYENGVDYRKINNYELFASFFNTEIQNQSIPNEIWSLMFENLDRSEIVTSIRKKDNKIVFCNKNGDLIIDEDIYEKIANIFRQINLKEKNTEYLKVPTDAGYKYIIDRMKLKHERMKRDKKNISSELDGYILLLVNNHNFKYNFQTVNDITIYDFYCSFKQIYKDKEVDGLLSAYFYGHVKAEDLTENKLNRIII